MPRTLPLFPLPLILFPGVALPLHIFEPRYRRMLADCLEGDRRFGVVFLPDGLAEAALPAGQVGTVAVIEGARPLPDGRSNIVVRGAERFVIHRLVGGDAPYHVAEIGDFADDEEAEEAQTAAADRVRTEFERVARAARTISDDRNPVPALPGEPGLLSFRVASLIDLGPSARQSLLSSRSPLARLLELEAVLLAAIDPMERRAATHARAKQNGQGAAASP